MFVAATIDLSLFSKFSIGLVAVLGYKCILSFYIASIKGSLFSILLKELSVLLVDLALAIHYKRVWYQSFRCATT